MQIGIGLKEHAYTPEAYAYKRYLEANGVSVQLESELSIDPNNDVNIFFMGLRPFWRRYKGSAKEIHEYQSLSINPHAKFKDFLKKSLNKKPSGRIFLNDIVKSGMSFKDSTPYVYRDMGVDDELFQKPLPSPEFDIVYCGSIIGRPGLIEELTRLANLGFKLLIVGSVNNEVAEKFKGYSNIQLTGRVDRDEIPSLYKQCRSGLNFTPDIYPFNIQTSTKTLEYLASGLNVITNKYEWVNSFSKIEGYNFLYLDNIKEYICFDLASYSPEKIEKYSWSNILTEANLLNFINSLD